MASRWWWLMFASGGMYTEANNTFVWQIGMWASWRIWGRVRRDGRLADRIEKKVVSYGLGSWIRHGHQHDLVCRFGSCGDWTYYVVRARFPKERQCECFPDGLFGWKILYSSGCFCSSIEGILIWFGWVMSKEIKEKIKKKQKKTRAKGETKWRD